MAKLGGPYTRVSQFINDGNWVLPSSTSTEVNVVRNTIKGIEIPKRKISPSNSAPNIRLEFHYLATSSIPKHSHRAYRAVLGHLLTKARLNQININTDLRCFSAILKLRIMTTYSLNVHTVHTYSKDAN